MIQLRPYQERGVEDIRAAFLEHQYVLYTAPTGSGKTVVFCYIAHHAVDLGNCVGILVHRQELIDQVCAALRDENVPHGVIAPGWPETDDPVQVCSVQTLVRRKERLFDIFISDEAHHGVANTWSTLFDKYSECAVLGVTATPCRLSGKPLNTRFTYMVHGPTVTELTPEYLCPSVVYAPVLADAKGIKRVAGDYNRDDLEKLMNERRITGDVIGHWGRLAQGKQTVISCVTVAHAQAVAAEFTSACIPTHAIYGSMPNQERRDLVGAFSNREFPVLTFVDLISEGFDCPGIEAMVMCRPTASESLCIQQMGRTLRIAPNKTHAIIIDHVGNCLRHGLPDSPRNWSLEQGLVRPKSEKSTIRQCPHCYFVHPIQLTVCPACGYEHAPDPEEQRKREPKYKSGELVQLTRDMREQLIESANSLQEYQDIAKGLNYKSGWAWFEWRKRNGMLHAKARVG